MTLTLRSNTTATYSTSSTYSESLRRCLSIPIKHASMLLRPWQAEEGLNCAAWHCIVADLPISALIYCTAPSLAVSAHSRTFGLLQAPYHATPVPSRAQSYEPSYPLLSSHTRPAQRLLVHAVSPRHCHATHPSSTGRSKLRSFYAPAVLPMKLGGSLWVDATSREVAHDHRLFLPLGMTSSG